MLGGVQVAVNGVPASLLFVSNSMITFQCPTLPPNAPIELTVQTQEGITKVPIQGTMAAATPALFALDAVRPGQGVVLIGNSNTLAMPSTDGFSGRPALQGEYVSILANGLGDVEGTWPALAKNAVRVWIGGTAVNPSFVGLIPRAGGLFQITFRIPQGSISGPLVPLYVEVSLNNGQILPSNQVVIAIDE